MGNAVHSMTMLQIVGHCSSSGTRLGYREIQYSIEMLDQLLGYLNEL